MKHEKIGMKWKIFLYLLGFTAILLAILWFFQTVYLEDFYKKIKTNELENAVENIESIIDEENIEDAIELIGSSYDICILVTDGYGNQLYSSEQNMQCTIHKQRTEDIRAMIVLASLNGGNYSITAKSEQHGLLMVEDGLQNNSGNMYLPDRFHNMPDMTTAESIISVNIMEKDNGSQRVVFINSIITPVDATVHTLRIQLIYISIIMVVLALLMAVIISWHISKPIIKINDAAKNLGKAFW